jgi:hypothetical protein
MIKEWYIHVWIAKANHLELSIHTFKKNERQEGNKGPFQSIDPSGRGKGIRKEWRRANILDVFCILVWKLE